MNKIEKLRTDLQTLARKIDDESTSHTMTLSHLYDNIIDLSNTALQIARDQAKRPHSGHGTDDAD